MTIDRSTRLLLFTNSVQVGGMEEHVRLIARELHGRRFDVSVVMPDWEETNWFAARIGAEAGDLTLITPDRRPGAPHRLREAVRLVRHVRSRGIEVAHLHSTTYEGVLLALLAIRAAGVGRIFITEHLAPEAPIPTRHRLVRRLAERLATGIVSVSARNRDARLRHLGGDPQRIHVVDNGIDVDRFATATDPVRLDGLRRRHDLPADADIVGTAIRLEPGKGVADLVDGFARVRMSNPRAHLLIVGDGSLRGELEARIGRLGIADHVTMTGFSSEPHPYIELMDVFVIPVPYGSASIGLLEAMALSKACVISFGGDGEAVVPGESGLWADPNDPESIAQCVAKLLDDPELRAGMAQAARVRVERHFSSTRMADELARLYLGDPSAAGATDTRNS